MDNSQKPKFIIDKEVDLSKIDLLGTQIYVDVLKGIIAGSIEEENSPSMSIGLFGEWGSGKSSVITSLKDKYKDSKDVKFVYYDAWKHSKDSFRRSFLDTLVRSEFELKPKINFGRLYDATSTKFKYSARINWKDYSLSIFIRIIPAIIILFLILSTDSDKAIIAGIAFISMALFQFIPIAGGIKIGTSKGELLFSQDQFLEIFTEIIEIVTGKRSNEKRCFFLDENKWISNETEHQFKKIVIAIDNIDRCGKSVSVELLRATKNFLEIDDCVIIIPIDDKSIISHLPDYNDIESKEYLRKFFNIVIRLKRYSQLDLFDFTKILIQKHFRSIVEPTQNILSQMISSGVSSNPRRIIQFLNNLIAEIEILKNIEEKEGELSKNILFVAKTLIIKNEWNDIYNLISYDLRLLETLENRYPERLSLTSYSFPQITNKFLPPISEKPCLVLEEEECNFFRSTRRIRSKTPEKYFRLKPALNKVNELIYRKFSRIEKYVEESDGNFGELIQAFELELDKTIFRRNSMKLGGLDLINNCIQLFMRYPEAKGLSDTINIYLKEITPSMVRDLEPDDLLFRYINKCDDSNKKIPIDLIDEYMADTSIEFSSKKKILDLSLKYLSHLELNEYFKRAITNRLLEYKPIELSWLENVSMNKNVFESDSIKEHIEGNAQNQEERNDVVLRFLISNDLLDEKNVELFLGICFHEMDQAASMDGEMKIENQLENLSAIAKKGKFNQRIIKFLSDSVIDQLTEEFIAIKYFHLVEILIKNANVILDSRMIDFLQFSLDNSENVQFNENYKLGELIFFKYELTKSVLNLGIQLAISGKKDSKNSIFDRISDNITEISDEILISLMPVLFDEKAFTPTQLKELASKICISSSVKAEFKVFMKANLIQKLNRYKAIFSDIEIEDLVYEELFKIRTNAAILLNEISKFDGKIKKEILFNALNRLFSKNQFSQQSRTIMCRTLNSEIQKREL